MASKSFSQATDNRTEFASGSGLQVAPEGAVNAAGAASANASGSGSSVSQQINTTNEGYVADDVIQILSMMDADRAGERSAWTGLGQSLAAGVLAQSTQAADTLAATKAPDSTTLTKIMPLLILLAAAYFLTRS